MSVYSLILLLDKHAFIGLGFLQRNEAFEFQVAMQDFEKYSELCLARI